MIAVWPQRWAEPGGAAVRLPARRRRPGQRRHGDPHRARPRRRPGRARARIAPTPSRPKAVRASMGSIFARPPARAERGASSPATARRARRPRRRARSRRPSWQAPLDALPRRRARGPAGRACSRRCDGSGSTIPLRAAAPSRSTWRWRRRSPVRARYRSPASRDGLSRSSGSRSCAPRPRRRSPARPSAGELEELRVRYLGRKAELTTILRGSPSCRREQRGPVGKAGNEARQALEAAARGARRRARRRPSSSARSPRTAIDVTLPGLPPAAGGAPATC